MKTLLKKSLIIIKGRQDSPGRPLLYSTTKEFLDHFGLNRLSDMPKLKEVSELIDSDPSLGEQIAVFESEELKKDIDNLSFNIKYINASIDVNDNPQSPSYPALSFMSRKILPGQGGSPFSVPVTWYGRPLGSAFPSPISPKDIDQYHLSGSVNIELDNQANLELSLTKRKHKNYFSTLRGYFCLTSVK